MNTILKASSFQHFSIVSSNLSVYSVQFSSVQSLSRVQLFATPWTVTCQASLSITNSQSLPVKSWLTGKNSDAGRDWGQEEKGTTEDEMAGWHHWLDGRSVNSGSWFRQGGLACCDSWGRKESDTTEWLIWSERLNWTELKFLSKLLLELSL